MMTFSRGMTLIQLVITLVIIGILYTFAVPHAFTVQFTAKEQAQQVASDIKALRILAETNNQRYRINFSAGSYSTWLQNGTTPVLMPNAHSNTNIVTLASGMVLSSTNITNGYLVFDSLGRPYVDNGTPGTLLTTDATITITYGATSSTFTIYANTGAVE